MMILIVGKRGIFMRACFCPNCGASLKFEDDNRDFGFCQFCGAKIMLDDYRSTHRVVDEARIHEDETNRMIRLREMEMEEKEWNELKEKHEQKHKIALKAYCIEICGLTISIIFFMLFKFSDTLGLIGVNGFFLILLAVSVTVCIDNENQENIKKLTQARFSNKIIFDFEAGNYIKKDYQIIYNKISLLGFKNITLINLKDLNTKIFIKPDTVFTVTINGIFPRKGEWYDPNDEVEIKYHGLKNN